MARLAHSLIAGSLSLALAACSGDLAIEPPDPEPVDRDADGFTAGTGEGFDCDDFNRFISPGAAESCDGIDNDCDGRIDEDFDKDGDFWTTCLGDCADNNAASFPGATEIVDGFDNDCDGIADNNTTAYDDDGDGYSEDQGDCNDDPTLFGALINPGSVEVQVDEDGMPEGLDNDCDGVIDEAIAPCPGGGDRHDPMAYVNAIEACHNITQAVFPSEYTMSDLSRRISDRFGEVLVPVSGSEFAILSTGVAGDTDAAGPSTNLGTQFTAPHPDPQPDPGDGCGKADSASVNDFTAIELHLLVPGNANGFSFDFNFMSIEFPEFVCSSFDDTFLAMLDSQAFQGNVSFDAMGNRVSINIGFISVCAPNLDPACTGDDELAGTGYGGSEGGGTGWLTTTAPVIPGEKITLTFMIFDEGDHILDSMVLIDNFRWQIEPVDGPITVPRLPHTPGILAGPRPAGERGSASERERINTGVAAADARR